eukprot:8885253-Ditylum_brightwellii.AAC.1
MASMSTYTMNSDQFSADELRGTTPVSEESSDLALHPDAANTSTFYDDYDSDSDDQTDSNNIQEDNTIKDAILTAYQHYKDLDIIKRIDTNQLK